MTKPFNYPHLLDLRLKGLKGLKTYDFDSALHAAGLDLTMKNMPVHRQLLSQNCGGRLQDTTTRPAAHFVAYHKIADAFAYPMLTVNPHAPTVAGRPGLFFNDEFKEGEIYYVVFGLGVNQWLFLGRYIFRGAPSLTVEEWEAIPTAVSLLFNVFRSASSHMTIGSASMGRSHPSR